MKITEVKLVPTTYGPLRAYVSLTFDDCFVVSEIKLMQGDKGYWVVMPRRKRAKGKYIDIIAPINKKTRQMIEETIFAAYKLIADEPVKRRF